jgi:hypothetical protein
MEGIVIPTVNLVKYLEKKKNCKSVQMDTDNPVSLPMKRGRRV